MQIASEWHHGCTLPLPASADTLATAKERWEDFSKRSTESHIEQLNSLYENDSFVRALFYAVWGNSPYLTQLFFKHSELIHTLLMHGNTFTLSATLEEINLACENAEKIEDVMRDLRIAKQKISLQLAFSDISNVLPLEEVTHTLTQFAELSIMHATRFALKRAAEQGELELHSLEKPEEHSGFIILAMGKLGANELNYSSDIDLIVFFDPEITRYKGTQSTQQCAIKITKDIVRILDERTRDGYVFRTDLRLRPDPSSMPMAISTVAALRYYESVGQNWERAAMIKARAIAGDIQAGENFLNELRPFIWRKYLDFAALQDIHSIKRQISSKKEDIPTELNGYNIKLGHGGIREIEFFVQTQQLIWGGRLPILRVRSTCDALRILAEEKKIKAEVAEELIEIYRFLRTLEHRLQMVADAQTHNLPLDDNAFEEIAIFMGCENKQSFNKILRTQLLTVQKHYARLFKSAPTLSAEKSLVFTGVENDPETVKNLERLGFSQPDTIAQLIRQWHHGRHRATRSKRARELLTELTPAIVKIFSATVDPDAAFLNFDEFLSRLPMGVQPFSLFTANPSMLELMAEIMGSFPNIANNLANHPALLEYVLYPDFSEPLLDKAVLAKELSQALRYTRDYEEILNSVRRWTHERQFKVGTLLIRQKITPAQARQYLSHIADTVLMALLPRVKREFKTHATEKSHNEYALIALGKFGGEEMTFESDLDLIFLYGDEINSEAPEEITAAQYYQRLARRLITAMSSLTPEGKLYDIDMRLRPSANDGPLATHTEAFDRYYAHNAWDVELMALTRARILSESKSFKKTTEQMILQHLIKKRDAKNLAQKIREVREKINQQHPVDTIWDIKYAPGGLVDCEFLIQYLELIHANTHTEVLDNSIEKALEKLRACNAITEEDFAILSEGYTLQLNIQTLLRLMFIRSDTQKIFTRGVKQFLYSTLNFSSFEALEQRLEFLQSEVGKRVDSFLPMVVT